MKCEAKGCEKEAVDTFAGCELCKDHYEQMVKRLG